MHALQIATLLVSAMGSGGQKLDTNGRPKCCADSLSPLIRQQSWLDVLRQATYQSVIRHLDYSGTLDGRLDRDHTLWNLLRQARYIEDAGGGAVADIITGALIERPDTDQIDFEFRQEDRSVFDCARSDCDGVNGSVMALWRVRAVDDPNELWITVKVPNAGNGRVEDVYKYGTKYGLQKLNPDPLQLKSVKSDNHRFFIPSKTRGERKLTSRMDFMFPGESKGKSFGVGRLAPPPYAYESPVLPERSIDGWSFAARKPHPGVVLDAGLRSHHQGPVFNPLLGPFIAEGPQGYRHVIYSLPSIAPPQKLDSQDVRGFLPSMGPIVGPPVLPFRTPYTKYHNERPAQYITPPLVNFTPSKELVRYSELDPLYHSEGEHDFHTSQTPGNNVPRTTVTFPSSVNDVLPTESPLVPTNRPMQIIVKGLDEQDQQDRSTRRPLTTTQPSKLQKSKTRLATKPTPKSSTTPGDKSLTKVFGQKIKPKNSTMKPGFSTDGKVKYTTTKLALLPQNTSRNKNITRHPTYATHNTGSTVVNKSYTHTETNLDKHFNKNTTPPSNRKPESTETTERVDVFTEFTTEEINKQTTYLDLDTTTDSDEYESNTSIFVTELPTKEKKVMENNQKTKETMIVGIKPYQSKDEATNPLKLGDHTKNASDIYDDYYTDETTDAPLDLTTVETYNPETTKSTETDFLPTLTDALFAIETTTQMNNETTTITPKENANEHNADAETQESQQQRVEQYRLLTFPGDSVSIVANRISKSVSYRTADGKERKLQHKLPTSSVDRYSTRLRDYYSDYSTIL